MENVNDSQIGERIIRLRELRGWTQGQLAAALRSGGLNWSQGTLSKVESGSRPVRLAETPTIIAVLGASVSDLIGSETFTLTEQPSRVAELEADQHRLRRAIKAAIDSLGEYAEV